jgi:hypothetical protein
VRRAGRVARRDLSTAQMRTCLRTQSAPAAPASLAAMQGAPARPPEWGALRDGGGVGTALTEFADEVELQGGVTGRCQRAQPRLSHRDRR